MFCRLLKAVVTMLMAIHAAGDLFKQSLEDVDSLAVCNDGTPAVYYYKEARSNASTTWLVFLESGGQCYDSSSCKQRCQNEPGRCSSKDYGSSVSLGGIFCPLDNQDLLDAHKVYVKYCTSDAHMGNAMAFNRSFRGKIVVQAVLQSLVTKGLGSGSNGGRDRLIFGGASAGARGAMIHLEYVQEMLGPTAATNVDIVGFLDSPAYIDIAPMDASFEGFPYQTKQIHNYANVEHLGHDCQTMYPNEEWKCMYWQYRLPTIKTRFFLAASLEDSYQLGNDIGHSLAFNEAELAYADAFAYATRALGDTIALMPAKKPVYSWACYNHAMSVSNDGFNKRTCTGTTMTAAFKQFLDGDAASSLVWQDACATFRCGCASIDDTERDDRNISP